MENTALIDIEKNISLKAASTAAMATVAKAEALGIRINVAIVDRSGVLVAFLRMSGSPLHSAAIAEDKAYTAVSFGRDTALWNDILESRTTALRHGLMNRDRFAAFGGGLVILDQGDRIGGIGVSGGTEAQDIECAQAGLAAIGLGQ